MLHRLTGVRFWQVNAEVVFTTPHSIEVRVVVSALSPVTGNVRTTNIAQAWYVAKPFDAPSSSPRHGINPQTTELPPMAASVAVPQLKYPDAETERAGQQRWADQVSMVISCLLS